jgi:hypothetical protein
VKFNWERFFKYGFFNVRKPEVFVNEASVTNSSDLAVGAGAFHWSQWWQAADGLTIALGIVLIGSSVVAWSVLLKAALRRSTLENADVALLGGVAMVAPFLGLLGTVWGIMNTLISLGAQTTMNFQMISTPLGEALLMTALGLLVAIPAAAGQRWLIYLLMREQGETQLAQSGVAP